MAFSDRELLARIVQCEAGGEGDNRNESSCINYYEQSKCTNSVNIQEYRKAEI